MAALTWPSALLTLADWDALPEDELHRVECSEGVLIVVPTPAPRHQFLGLRLAGSLNRQLPAAFVAITEVDVLLEADPLTVRAPDVVVVPTVLLEANPPRFAAADVLLAVEVLSPGTRRQDRTTKRDEYADAGIEHYWVLDPSRPVTAVVHQLHEAAYTAGEPVRGLLEVELAGTSIEIELDGLLVR